MAETDQERTLVQVVEMAKPRASSVKAQWAHALNWEAAMAPPKPNLEL